MTPKIARSYARMTDKTLKRDLKALIERGLVEQTGGDYLAKRGTSPNQEHISSTGTLSASIGNTSVASGIPAGFENPAPRM